MCIVEKMRPLLLLALILATRPASAQDYEVVTLAEGLRHPWSVVQLPGGDFLVSERPGRLLRITATSGTIQEIEGGPKTLTGGQGGYFDIALHPQFEQNALVYLAYAQGTPGDNATTLHRARLRDNALIEGEDILATRPSKTTRQHYGGRLLFIDESTLLLSTGDGFDLREQAQSLNSELGKVLRVTDGGKPAPGNPFTHSGAERIWTLGHRNPQGLARDPVTHTIYLHEHGPRGGDELNVLTAGNNYGWPAVTYGMDYSGAFVSPFQSLPGMTEPLHTWTPSIAPSGMTVYRGDAFPDWQGDLLVGALVPEEVRLLELQQGRISAEKSLFREVGERIRDVRTGRDGLLYLLTDSEQGRLIQIRPAPATSAGAGEGTR